MESETRKQLAALLRAAAAQTVAEDAFWDKFNELVGASRDHAPSVAFESATHYWGNFHERNIFLIRVKPDRWQLEQGKDELNLIAEALDGDWPDSELDRRLKDI